MKKILILLFIVIYAAASFAATLGEKKAELSRVKRYIRSLDAKIVAARSARKINKLAELKDLKRRQLSRAKLIRKDIAKLQTEERSPEVKKEIKGQSISDRSISEKKAELARVKQYIRSLDAKIKAARSARNKKRLAQLKALKQRQLSRAKLIRKDIAKLQMEAKKELKGQAAPEAKAPGKKLLKDEWMKGRQFELGYGGGSLLLGGAYSFPFRKLNLQAKLGYGIGNGYSVLDAGIRALFAVRGNRIGVELGVASYSETVTDILGVAGNIDKGTKLGFGIFINRPVNLPRVGKVNVKVGYNTALGLTAGTIYKF